MTKCFYDLLDKLKIGIVLLDRRHRVIFWNDWMSKKTELTADSVLSMPIEDLSSKFASSRYSSILDTIFETGQSRFLSGAVHGTFFQNAEFQPDYETKQNLQIEKVDEHTLLIQVEDLSGHYMKVKQMKKFIEHLEKENDEIKQLEEKSRRIAMHDTLTELPNRLSFLNNLELKLNELKNSKSGKNLAVFFIDLDDLKKINDTYGHKIGDEILKEFANRISLLMKNCYSDCFIARLAGDEFVLFSESDSGIEKFENQANLILEQIHPSFSIKNHIPLKIRASIGISIYPNDAVTVDELIDKADKALYRVKTSGKNGYEFYKQL